jgi:peptide/nickel transport system ATP-binding protein
LDGLRSERDLAYLFVTHDLDSVRRIADRVLVMQAGRIIEQGSRDAVFNRPTHPYTRQLLAAAPGLAPAASRRSGGRDQA